MNRRTRLGAVAMAGLLGVLTACTSTRGGPAASPNRTAAASSDVSFVVDGTTTYGTLEVPPRAGDRKLAAALLLPGSGPTDRNGNQSGSGLSPDTLKLVADILAQQGIMTLRFDKYFSGKTGAGRFATDPASFTVQDDLDQVHAAYAFLGRQSQADPAKLLVVGHSYGGLLALQVASTQSPRPVALGLLEPQDLRALDLIRIQLDESIAALATQGTLSSDEARSNAAAVARAIEQRRAGQPVSTDGMAAPVARQITPLLVSNPQAVYQRSWDALMPVALASTVSRGTRVLVTDGTRDGKVPPSTIHPLIQSLQSAGVTGPGLQLIQGTDHDMHLAGQPDDQAVLAPAVVTAIQQWAQPFATTR